MIKNIGVLFIVYGVINLFQSLLGSSFYFLYNYFNQYSNILMIGFSILTIITGIGLSKGHKSFINLSLFILFVYVLEESFVLFFTVKYGSSNILFSLLFLFFYFHIGRTLYNSKY